MMLGRNKRQSNEPGMDAMLSCGWIGHMVVTLPERIPSGSVPGRTTHSVLRISEIGGRWDVHCSRRKKLCSASTRRSTVAGGDEKPSERVLWRIDKQMHHAAHSLFMEEPCFILAIPGVYSIL